MTLANGSRVACGQVVNAAGPGAGRVAALAGIDLPVVPLKHSLFVFDCREDLGQPLPLTIDPSGIHCRSEGEFYLAGAPAPDGRMTEAGDFEVDYNEFEDQIWPTMAARVPAFEAIKLVRAWAGHYDYNLLDQNAVIGPHPEARNLFFINGFSGHGLQQAAAAGRGVAELIAHGGYRSLDLSDLGYERIAAGRPFLETAII